MKQMESKMTCRLLTLLLLSTTFLIEASIVDRAVGKINELIDELSDRFWTQNVLIGLRVFQYHLKEISSKNGARFFGNRRIKRINKRLNELFFNQAKVFEKQLERINSTWFSWLTRSRFTNLTYSKPDENELMTLLFSKTNLYKVGSYPIDYWLDNIVQNCTIDSDAHQFLNIYQPNAKIVQDRLMMLIFGNARGCGWYFERALYNSWDQHLENDCRRLNRRNFKPYQSVYCGMLGYTSFCNRRIYQRVFFNRSPASPTDKANYLTLIGLCMQKFVVMAKKNSPQILRYQSRSNNTLGCR